MTSYRFEVFGKPVAKARPRHGNGNTYTPEATKKAEANVRAKALEAGVKPIDGPVFINIVSVFPIPKSWSRAKKNTVIWHTSRPDADNLSKLVKDALKGIAYADDAQVCFLNATKMYGVNARTMIEVGRL